MGGTLWYTLKPCMHLHWMVSSSNDVSSTFSVSSLSFLYIIFPRRSTSSTFSVVATERQLVLQEKCPARLVDEQYDLNLSETFHQSENCSRLVPSHFRMSYITMACRTFLSSPHINFLGLHIIWCPTIPMPITRYIFLIQFKMNF